MMTKQLIFDLLAQRCWICKFKAWYHKTVHINGETADLEKMRLRMSSKYFDSLNCPRFIRTNLEYLEYKYEKSLEDRQKGVIHGR